MAETKIRFGGDEWLAALQRLLAKLVSEAGSSIDGASVKILEIITDVPADMADPSRPDRSRAWHIVIEPGRAFAASGEIDVFDFGSVADYDSILRLARWVYTDDPADQAAVEAHRDELVGSGAFRPLGARPDMPPALGAMLRELHNSLARITA
jgi:hypothetical protein